MHPAARLDVRAARGGWVDAVKLKVLSLEKYIHNHTVINADNPTEQKLATSLCTASNQLAVRFVQGHWCLFHQGLLAA